MVTNYGNVQKDKIMSTDSANEIPPQGVGFTLHDGVRSLTVLEILRVESLLVWTEKSQLRRLQGYPLVGSRENL